MYPPLRVVHEANRGIIVFKDQTLLLLGNRARIHKMTKYQKKNDKNMKRLRKAFKRKSKT